MHGRVYCLWLVARTTSPDSVGTKIQTHTPKSSSEAVQSAASAVLRSRNLFTPDSINVSTVRVGVPISVRHSDASSSQALPKKRGTQEQVAVS